VSAPVEVERGIERSARKVVRKVGGVVDPASFSPLQQRLWAYAVGMMSVMPEYRVDYGLTVLLWGEDLQVLKAILGCLGIKAVVARCDWDGEELYAAVSRDLHLLFASRGRRSEAIRVAMMHPACVLRGIADMTLGGGGGSYAVYTYDGGIAHYLSRFLSQLGIEHKLGKSGEPVPEEVEVDVEGNAVVARGELSYPAYYIILPKQSMFLLRICLGIPLPSEGGGEAEGEEVRGGGE